MNWPRHVAGTIARQGALVRVSVIRAEGSTPREIGAAMLVGPARIEDTIGVVDMAIAMEGNDAG